MNLSKAGDRRTKVLMVTRNLPPLVGGMERLNWHMAAELGATCDVLVIGPQGCAALAPPNVAVMEVPLQPVWRFLLTALRIARREAIRRKPDLVLAGSGLSAPIAYMAARACGASKAVYVHGLDIIVEHLAYRTLWLPVLRRFDLAIANSANTADLARRAGIAGGRIRVVHPGTNLPDLQVGTDAEEAEVPYTDDGPVLLSVGRLTERKGLAMFIEHVLPGVVARHPRARLVVIGDEAPNALRKSGTDAASDVQAAVERTGMRDHVFRLGPCDDAGLDKAYRNAAVHVFPVRHVAGDVEGFGMVAIEAAARGLPTVAFAVGGVPDAVSDGVSGYLVSPGNYEAFAERVDRVLADREGAMKRGSRSFAAEFAWERFGEKIRSVLVGAHQGNDTGRQGHAVLDLASRVAKAKKIELLLGLAPGKPLRMLEIGTGSGGIAHYFGAHSTLEIAVDAVDVHDARQISEGYRFTRVEGADLPFTDGYFDVVISNHVIEHVGDSTAQARHLAEMNRVLRPGGIGYLAVPNRWMLVEPHYQLAFLSWWPRRWRTPYLRMMRRGEAYDCEPLTTGGAERLLAAAGFEFEQMHSSALRLTLEIDSMVGSPWKQVLKSVPDWAFLAARRAFPTLIYLLRKA